MCTYVYSSLRRLFCHHFDSSSSTLALRGQKVEDLVMQSNRLSLQDGLRTVVASCRPVRDTLPLSLSLSRSSALPLSLSRSPSLSPALPLLPCHPHSCLHLRLFFILILFCLLVFILIRQNRTPEAMNLTQISARGVINQTFSSPIHSFFTRSHY
eukprot:746005-Hanusia_phi.AAC.3